MVLGDGDGGVRAVRLTHTMNLSSWPCSKLSDLLSSLISSDLPRVP